MENAAQGSGKVELTLMGIDKKWVRSNGEWRDKSELDIKPVEMNVFEPAESSKKWWKFWSKS